MSVRNGQTDAIGKLICNALHRNCLLKLLFNISLLKGKEFCMDNLLKRSLQVKGVVKCSQSAGGHPKHIFLIKTKMLHELGDNGQLFMFVVTIAD